jgi:hypothetical protein
MMRKRKDVKDGELVTYNRGWIVPVSSDTPPGNIVGIWDEDTKFIHAFGFFAIQPEDIEDANL